MYILYRTNSETHSRLHHEWIVNTVKHLLSSPFDSGDGSRLAHLCHVDQNQSITFIHYHVIGKKNKKQNVFS